jgi:hypothetical protein
LLTRYVPDQPALVGHTYALEAYAEMFLAELYCSGIPLSTVDFDGDYTLRPGSTTTQVLTHAVALFDSASALVGDSARFVHLAAVGKARALLGLGRYAEAATAAVGVPDDYRYAVSYSSDGNASNFLTESSFSGGILFWAYSVADQEGANGLNYITSGDPRTAATAMGTNASGRVVYTPTMYALTGESPVVLASGIEARLIEAEAALQAAPDGGAWLAKLNALRTNGTFDTTATSPPDTLWHAGTGGVAGLGPLADPGTLDGRVDLLFRERAFWLFLTGHRQGDLRRLIRQYGRNAEDLYPVGSYPNGAGVSYGSDITMPIPPVEQLLNPLFTGCASRGA